MIFQIKRIRIGHDGSKPGAGWFLDEVVIDIPSRGECYTFAFHRWLDKSEDDGQLEVEMEPTTVDRGCVSKCRALLFSAVHLGTKLLFHFCSGLGNL